MYNDTIAAISTPLASAGIGIIRISGEEALSVIRKIFKPASDKKPVGDQSHVLLYGYITDPEYDRVLDEVLVSVMLAPNTYTKENVVEINTHGGVVVMQSILSLVLRHGARIAEPGEFTKRAFLNGRLDLSQAEAVMDIIESKTELALNASVKQLEGQLKKEIESLKKEILELIANIEASIDYPEYDVEEIAFERVTSICEEMSSRISRLVDSYDNGRIVREGIKTVIVGRPNVGKSSLLNALLKEQRAIVTDIPGTTRDSLEEYMNVHGIPLKLIDTAGIRSTEDIVERLGVQKSKELVSQADLVLFVINGSESLQEEDYQIMELIHNQKVICLVNKSDLDIKVDKNALSHALKDCTIIETSAIHHVGLDALESEIKEQFMSGQVQSNDGTVIHNIRHKQALVQAVEALGQVIESIQMGMPEDCWAIDLHGAYEHLCEVTGDKVTDDVIQQIFSQFCLGK